MQNGVFLLTFNTVWIHFSKVSFTKWMIIGTYDGVH